MNTNHFDVLILGAGLSGIGAACHLTRKLPGKTYAILENREAIGGTWDLFRYPGIRSDSDMTTFGYNFRPWNSPKMLADGPSIKAYVRGAAEDHGVVPHIKFGIKVVRIEWSTPQAMWTVIAINNKTGENEVFTARYLIGALGYYNYERGYNPEFPGQDDFKGTVIHPQFWPENFDYRDKKVVIIGSGATAVTLVPEMAKGGAKVTMLQRSPSYVISIPGVDPVWKLLTPIMPAKLVYFLLRVRNVLQGRMLFNAARRWPSAVRKLLLGLVKFGLKDAVDMKHFSPHYNPWEQRLCAVPNGDLFKSLVSGKARVVTDQIKEFDQAGIKLQSGKRLDADVIVKATGLELRFFGGADIVVDDQPVHIKDRMMFKGMMIEGVPNLLQVTGYTNASWTLKSDIVTEHFIRIIKNVDDRGMDSVTPRAYGAGRLPKHSMSHFSSGYVARGAHTYPQQGEEKPWVVLDDYFGDAVALKFGNVNDPALEYRKAEVVGKVKEKVKAAS